MWKKDRRPGFFGSRRDVIVSELNTQYGKDGWTLMWVADTETRILKLEFAEACKQFYEESYYQWFDQHPERAEWIAGNFSEVIDNAPTNVESGLDYTKQEAYSTHIQDIAIRNVLNRMGLNFTPGKPLLVVRGSDTQGFEFNPGQIPFYDPDMITKPSKAPKWANAGSVEDFWQSNKWICLRSNHAILTQLIGLEFTEATAIVRKAHFAPRWVSTSGEETGSGSFFPNKTIVMYFNGDHKVERAEVV